MRLKTAPLISAEEPRRVRIDAFSAVRRSFAAISMDGRRVAVSYEGEPRNKFIRRVQNAGWIVNPDK